MIMKIFFHSVEIFPAADFASCKYREIFCYNYDSNLPSGTSRRVNDSFCDGLQRLLGKTKKNDR